MLTAVISEFEPIRSSIKFNLRTHKKNMPIMQVNNISNINLDKIQHLVEENGSIVLILDLDTRIRLFSRFSYANEHIENILKTITNFDNITILITGSESAVLEYKHILESKKIFREKILIKPFNNLQLNQFISYNLTH